MILFLHILDYLLWTIFALSVVYVAFFSIASLLPERRRRTESQNACIADSSLAEFLILLPAYHEDTVIRQSVEALYYQKYPKDLYHVVVISDHMTYETNDWLSQQPISLLQPEFKKSSKAKALQYAIQQTKSRHYQQVVILDADNVVDSDFLSRLNAECRMGYQAIQCHRTAKNTDNNIAALDGISEEINNTIFRSAHNKIELSSALIGSGMCFSYDWLANHIDQLSTAVEDRELEALLLLERIHIHYAADIYVKDEKVSSGDNFQRQRLRWMTGQVQSFITMLPHIPKAITQGNVDYIDKTIQQALVPRSILLLVLPIFSVSASTIHWPASLKWWSLLVILLPALFIAIPRQLRFKALSSHVFALPALAWRMLKNVVYIKRNDTTFHHTEHTSK